MDIPDILEIFIFEDFLKIAFKKRPPKDRIGALFLEKCNFKDILKNHDFNDIW